jgi:membrane associated rhomboid family serine protease
MSSIFRPPTPAVKWILIITTVTWLLQMFTPVMEFEQTWLVLNPAMIMHGYVWQFVSYMLVHALNVQHLFFNMLGLYFFGPMVEASWGWKRFLKFYLLCGLGGGICAFFTGFVTLGASGAIMGVLVACAMLFPRDVVYLIILPMTMLQLVILLIALDVATLLVTPGGHISVAAHLGGAATGYLYLKLSWRIGVWFNSMKRSRPPARVVPLREGGRKARPVVTAGRGEVRERGSRASAANAAEEATIQKQADAVLDKISREGMASLSAEERAILTKHSQILKQRESGDVVNLDDYRS